MGTIGGLNLKLSASSDQLKADLARGGKEVESFAAQAKGALKDITLKSLGGGNPFGSAIEGAKNLAGAIPAVGPALAASMGVLESAAGRVKAKWDDVLDVRKLALHTGSTVGELGKPLAGAGDESEAVAHGMFRFALSLQEAKDGSADAESSFKKLGLTSKELSSERPAAAFMKVRDALAQVGNFALRAKLAQDIFGRGAYEMMEFLAKSPQEIEGAYAKAVKQGRALSDQDAATAKMAKKDWSEFGGFWEGLWTRISVKAGEASIGWKELLSTGTLLSDEQVRQKAAAAAGMAPPPGSLVPGAGNTFYTDAKAEAERSEYLRMREEALAAGKRRFEIPTFKEFGEQSDKGMGHVLDKFAAWGNKLSDALRHGITDAAAAASRTLERIDLIKSARTPFEKFQGQVQYWQRLLGGAGPKSQAALNRLVGGQAEQMLQGLAAPPPLPGALREGSAEALRSEYLRQDPGRDAERGRTPAEQLLKVAEAQKAAQERQERLGQEVVRLLGKVVDNAAINFAEVLP